MASRLRLLLLPAAVALAPACGSSTLAPARILEVIAPAQPTNPPTHIGYIGEDLILSVSGENFSAGIVPNAGSPDDSNVDSPRIFVQVQGSSVRIAVQGTFLSPTLFEGPLPVTPGTYDLTLENGDGTVDSLPDAFTMGHRAVTYYVISTSGIEGLPGDANRMDLHLDLRAANGESGIWKDQLDLALGLSGVAALETVPDFLIDPGETFEATVGLLDTSVELVTITASLPTGIALEQSFATTEFIPGTPFQARLLPATEIGATNTAETFFQIEDEWGNPCAVHLRYQADFGFQATCPGADAVPNPVVVASNAGSVPVTVTCIAPGALDVFFTESVTATNYGDGVTVIDFN